MNIPTITEGMKLSIPPFNDNNWRIIHSYKTSLFTPEKSDAAFFCRLAEIFLLGNMRPLADKLMSLTGITLSAPQTSADEINNLLERCAAIINREKEEYDRCSRESSKAEHALMSLKQPAQSVTDSRSRNKSAMHDAANNAERAAVNLINQGERVKHMMGLAGLLYDEASYFKDTVDIKRCLPRANRIPAIFTRNNEFLFAATTETCEAIRLLRLAAEDIVRKCTPPTDKYELSHGGIIKSQACRYYYHPDNDLLRAIVSADDYASYIAKFGWHVKFPQASVTENTTE
ncbi:hypothetical protein CA048_04765 [Salmonella enterica]|nr:hypothetical protein [Salmonella enterica]EBR7328946.1 hypothetical protein [Salmonella enterica]